MRTFYAVILVILVFLAVSSGITKILLMQQDVEFFGKYGFTGLVLVIFGVAQLLGGLLMIAKKTRFVGAAVVTITFLISAALLAMEGNIPLTIVTFVAISFLVLVMKQSLTSQKRN